MNDTTQTINIPVVPMFWDYTIGNDEPSESEYPTRQAAMDAAQDKFVLRCSEGDDYLESRTEECTIMQFSYDADGERRVVHAEKADVEYGYEPSDAEEHGTWG